ncbi:hypothetical protein J3E68DRAFT_439520 [Trichoderma sp. SZMC 28012]
MSNAFALSVGLRRGSYYQVWNLHKFSDENPAQITAVARSLDYCGLCSPTTRHRELVSAAGIRFLQPSKAGNDRRRPQGREPRMLSILIKSPCTVSGSPRTGYPIPGPRQYKYGEVTCAAARLAKFLPRTCPARAQTRPSLSCGGKCHDSGICCVYCIYSTNSTIVWPCKSSKAVRLRTCALHYLDASMQTRRIGYKRDTSGHGGVRGRPPYVALVPWSVPRQSPAASHRVEKHSAVAHPRPKEKSHSSRRMQLADSQYRSSPSGS